MKGEQTDAPIARVDLIASLTGKIETYNIDETMMLFEVTSTMRGNLIIIIHR